MVRSVAILPGAGEFSYAAVAHRRGADGSEVTQNVHAIADRADFLVSLDNLQAAVPNLEAVTLIASWFGDDLRAVECETRPRVEQDVHSSTPDNWCVNDLDWTNALVVTANANGLPVFGGTPSDSSIVQAIQKLTVPAHSAVAFPSGSEIELVALGAGVVTIAGDTGVTINGVLAGSADIAAQWQGTLLRKYDTDAWLLIGAVGEMV